MKRLYLCLPKKAKEMIGKKIPVVFRILFVIWVILQVCLVIKYWNMPNHDDAQAYVKLASECIARGTWYPDVHNQYEDFIFGPGYVNLLIGIYHLCGSFSFVRLLNLLMNIAMVFEIRKLAGRMFSNKTGYYAAILYMLIFSNLYAPIAVLTDLPFTFLLLTALLLCNVRRLFPVAVAGVLIGKNAETRRYLNRIRRAKFLERWNGLSMEELPGKEIDAVTGATLSCDAISHGVRRLAERCLKRISEERVAAENRSEQVRLTRRIASLKKDLEEGKARDVQPRKGNEVELRLIAAVQGADAAKAFAAKHGLRFFAHMVPRPPKRTGNRLLSGPDAALAAYRKEPSEQNLVALRAAILSDYEFHLGLRNRDNARALKNAEARLRELQAVVQ